MALKRTVTLEPDQGPVAKRLRRVERQVRANRPEMKFTQIGSNAATATAAITAVNITAIAQGDSVNGRDGNKIKTWRCEIRGEVDPLQDVFLIQSHNGDIPVYADFLPQVGGFVQGTQCNVKFTEWAYMRPSPDQTTNCPVRIVRKFRGMEISFSGLSTAADRNALYLVIKNNSGGSLNHNLSTRVWYTDA